MENSGKMQDWFSEQVTPPANMLPLPSSQTVGSEASYKALKAHQEASWERVRAASHRLHGILLSDNPAEFAKQNPIPPHPPLTVNPALRHLRGSVPPFRPPPPPANVGRRKLLDAALLGDGKEVDRMIKEAKVREERNANMVGIKSCEDCPGFREKLLFYGKQAYGEENRRVVTSISFHDLTPTLEGDYSDVCVLHFEAGFANGISLVCTDVNIPTQPQAESTTKSSRVVLASPPEIERWMSFLITVPLVAHAPGVKPTLPPNMCGPIPASWVLIAAPIHSAHIYPFVRESLTLRSPTGVEFVQTVKRTDYDFSRNFPPVFEFMDKEAVLGPVGGVLKRRIGTHFLNGTGLQSYQCNNDVALDLRSSHSSGDATQGQGTSSAVASSEASTVRSPSVGSSMIQLTKEQIAKWTDIETMGARMIKSHWWREAEVSFIGDWDDWNQIRIAMRTGNCRVIVRVDEAVEAAIAKAYQPRRLGASIVTGNRMCGTGPGHDGPSVGDHVGGPMGGPPPPQPILRPYLGTTKDDGKKDEEDEEYEEKVELAPSPLSSGPQKKKAKKSGRKRNNKRK